MVWRTGRASTIGEEAAVWAVMNGETIDVDWMGRVLRREDYGTCDASDVHPAAIWKALELRAQGFEWQYIETVLPVCHDTVLRRMGQSPRGARRHPVETGHA